MKNIRRNLENTLKGVVEDIRFFDVRGELDRVISLEVYADEIKDQLNILSSIENDREGNLISFNADGTFRLWCIRIPDGGEQIVEYYNVDLDFEQYDELLEAADCIDVTDIFDIEAIANVVIVADNINDCIRRDAYYFVTNDAIDTMRVWSL
jgi:hypothetical protein